MNVQVQYPRKLNTWALTNTMLDFLMNLGIKSTVHRYMCDVYPGRSYITEFLERVGRR